MKKILITGANSYIGMSVEAYLRQWPECYHVDTLDMMDAKWRDKDFRGYDTVYHVAGIAHSDTGRISEERRTLYYRINTDLTIETAKKAKADGVPQFIFMSSAIVYGGSAPIGKKKHITRDTVAAPENCYGDSKLQAEMGLHNLEDERFKVVILRPPMIYGKGSKGNYPLLSKIAQRIPAFPCVENERSMLYIGNLAEFVRLMIENEECGVFWPQNATYSNTSELVSKIAQAHGKRVLRVKGVTWMLKLLSHVTGLVNKAFGSLTYDMEMSEYAGGEYRRVDLDESIWETEGVAGKKALVLASVASMIDQFNMQNIRLLQELGYTVDVIANFEQGGTITAERTQQLKDKLQQMGVRVVHAPIPRKISSVGEIWKAYRITKQECRKNRYVRIHCHSPIGGVIARMAARKLRKSGTRVIYTAHGFHFYKGAPAMNWLMFYPIEKLCARWTDTLITINKEDYRFAKQHMKAGNVVYVPGIGVDTKSFSEVKGYRTAKRLELGLPEDAPVLLSVGELNRNKNHEVVIRAMAKLGRDDVHYCIAGRGALDAYLTGLAKELGMESRLHLLGYRTDIRELLGMADIFVFPSFREGLSVSLMEAMAAGLPCVAGRIRGNVDLIESEKGGFLIAPDDADGFCKAMEELCEYRALGTAMGEYNQETIVGYDKDVVIQKMRELYMQ